MEYIDIVNEEGLATGLVESRADVHKKGLWHRAVHIWLINNNKEILLQKRSLNKESHPGLWDISCAGHISSGETSREAALKELEEELGILALEEELEFLFSQKMCFTQNNGKYIDNEIHDTFRLLKNINIEEIIIQEEEIEEVKYISFEAFENLVKTSDQRLVQHSDEYCRILENF